MRRVVVLSQFSIHISQIPLEISCHFQTLEAPHCYIKLPWKTFGHAMASHHYIGNFSGNLIFWCAGATPMFKEKLRKFALSWKPIKGFPPVPEFLQELLRIAFLHGLGQEMKFLELIREYMWQTCGYKTSAFDYSMISSGIRRESPLLLAESCLQGCLLPGILLGKLPTSARRRAAARTRSHMPWPFQYTGNALQSDIS